MWERLFVLEKLLIQIASFDTLALFDTFLLRREIRKQHVEKLIYQFTQTRNSKTLMTRHEFFEFDDEREANESWWRLLFELFELSRR